MEYVFVNFLTLIVFFYSLFLIVCFICEIESFLALFNTNLSEHFSFFILVFYFVMLYLFLPQWNQKLLFYTALLCLLQFILFGFKWSLFIFLFQP
uniref:NADH dehydrogenase subunit 4L n=1 Tax=Panagrolaimus sp. ES5 TaxID=591445 RepID=A0AC34F2A8_9BILA